MAGKPHYANIITIIALASTLTAVTPSLFWVEPCKTPCDTRVACWVQRIQVVQNRMYQHLLTFEGVALKIDLNEKRKKEEEIINLFISIPLNPHEMNRHFFLAHSALFVVSVADLSFPCSQQPDSPKLFRTCISTQKVKVTCGVFLVGFPAVGCDSLSQERENSRVLSWSFHVSWLVSWLRTEKAGCLCLLRKRKTSQIWTSCFPYLLKVLVWVHDYS